jgi:hypothetical protein
MIRPRRAAEWQAREKYLQYSANLYNIARVLKFKLWPVLSAEAVHE